MPSSSSGPSSRLPSGSIKLLAYHLHSTCVHFQNSTSTIFFNIIFYWLWGFHILYPSPTNFPVLTCLPSTLVTSLQQEIKKKIKIEQQQKSHLLLWAKTGSSVNHSVLSHPYSCLVSSSALCMLLYFFFCVSLSHICCTDSGSCCMSHSIPFCP